jgi:hypothetical protein
MVPVQDAKRLLSQAEASYYVEVCDVHCGHAQNANRR